MATSLSPSSHIRSAFPLYVDGVVLTVRGARAQDLPGVALMHSRCSAKSLLDRYRSGGRPPALIVLDQQVRDELSFVVTSEDGRVVAFSRAGQDARHGAGSAEIALLVEDQWQQLGIGRSLLRHTAAAASLTGFRQLVSYPGTTTSTVQRLMAAIGPTRVIAEDVRHLHTGLPDSVRLGLGMPGTLGSLAPVVRDALG